MPMHLFPTQVEVENFVLRVAAEFSSRKEQLIFLINNYDMMLSVLMVTPPTCSRGSDPQPPAPHPNRPLVYTVHQGCSPACPSHPQPVP